MARKKMVPGSSDATRPRRRRAAGAPEAPRHDAATGDSGGIEPGAEPEDGADPAAPETARRGARMADVAELAGVSAMTVSRALRNPRIVTPETLRRIEEAIRTVGYLPNRMAGNLSSSRSNIVGLVVPSLRNSLFAETIQGVADILRPDYDLLVANSGYTLKGEEAAVAAFLSQRVCGLVLHNVRHTPRTRQMIKVAGVPCVETGNLTSTPIDTCVGFSNIEAARAMTRRLIARGYRRIGFVSLPLKENDRAAERRAGFEAAMAEAGLEVNPDVVLEAPPGLAGGGNALRTIRERAPETEAVFLTGDVLATGAILAASRWGIDVPGEIAIVGSDDNELQEHVTPSLTSLRFPRYEIGRSAANILIDRVTGRSEGSAVVDLGFRIIERESD